MVNTKDSALAQQVYDNDHSIDWDNSKSITGKENHLLKRKLKEAWMIAKIEQAKKYCEPRQWKIIT